MCEDPCRSGCSSTAGRTGADDGPTARPVEAVSLQAIRADDWITLFDAATTRIRAIVGRRSDFAGVPVRYAQVELGECIDAIERLSRVLREAQGRVIPPPAAFDELLAFADGRIVRLAADADDRAGRRPEAVR